MIVDHEYRLPTRHRVHECHLESKKKKTKELFIGRVVRLEVDEKIEM